MIAIRNPKLGCGDCCRGIFIDRQSAIGVDFGRVILGHDIDVNILTEQQAELHVYRAGGARRV